MKGSVCEKDLRTNALCRDCRQKLDSKEITEFDIKACRILKAMEKRFFLEDIELIKAIDLGEIAVLVGKGKIGLLIGKQGRTVIELSKQFGKKVRIVEDSKNEKKMIQDLVGNARVVGLNKEFKAGKESFKVIIPKTDSAKLIAPKETLERALAELLKTKTTIDLV